MIVQIPGHVKKDPKAYRDYYKKVMNSRTTHPLLFALFLTLLSHCLTLTNYRMSKTVNGFVSLDDELVFTGAEVSHSGWIRLNFQGLREDGTYYNCIAPDSKVLEICPENFAPSRPAVNELQDLPPGIYYLKYGVVFHSQHLERSLFLDHAEQFGAPIAAFIHTEGQQVALRFRIQKMHKNVCYILKVNQEGHMDPAGDCHPSQPPYGFHSMERRSLEGHTLLDIFPPSYLHQGPNRQEYVLIQRKGSFQHVRIRNVSGTEPQQGYPILVLLYPFTLALDIVTLPIQYFFWRPACPLG